MALIYAGIDEAGYGPMLGPLTVGLSVLRVDGWSPGDPAPDLWAMLGEAVCRTVREAAGGRLAVGDSKVLKLSNSSKTRHPLLHLERGVLGHLSAIGKDHAPCADDASLLERVGATLEPGGWYGAEPVALPLGTTEGELRVASGVLRRELERAGVEVLALRCLSLDESRFNEVYRRAGSKAAVTELALREHLSTITRRWGGSGDAVRIACDRQSGRLDYSGVLREAWPDALVHERERSPRASRYEVELSGITVGSTGGEDVHVILTPGAEAAHYPVALASMLAKLVRELAMARFNSYWCGRVPELKPTAGYVQDARRWLRDLGDGATPEERTRMVRLA
ncbi:MAG: hypothetical protein AAF356_04580 [Planctomycetota bacterium]